MHLKGQLFSFGGLSVIVSEITFEYSILFVIESEFEETVKYYPIPYLM